MQEPTFEKIGPCCYLIRKSEIASMRADVRLYVSAQMLDKLCEDKSWVQIVNVASMPGVCDPVHLMPDAHFGYGFPIGAVAAFDALDGYVSPGGVGADINCGVRLMATDIVRADVTDKTLDGLADRLFDEIPSGLGVGGRLKLVGDDLDDVLRHGARAIVERGHGEPEDLARIEDGGELEGADPEDVSDKAKTRGETHVGTLGSGNHFLEVQTVEEVFDVELAERWSVRAGMLAVMIHSGSRGLGYQVSDEYWKKSRQMLKHFGIEVTDAQLAPLPVQSDEGKRYLSAMRCAANYGFANRQMMMHLVRKCFEKVFGRTSGELGLNLVYDVAHNIAKEEEHGGRSLLVHRKGATRAFPGQPVIIPGDMGTGSYLLAGTDEAKISYYTVCHGAGRVMSRTAANRQVNVRAMLDDLKRLGIRVRGHSTRGLAEEAPQAYKNIDDVIDAVVVNGLARKVARLKPVCVIKG